jgi:hypothetical protein
MTELLDSLNEMRIPLHGKAYILQPLGEPSLTTGHDPRNFSLPKFVSIRPVTFTLQNPSFIPSPSPS